MSTFLEVRAAIAADLATAYPALKITDYVPGTITPPAAFLLPGETFREISSTDSVDLSLVVVLLTGNGTDQGGQSALDAYVDVLPGVIETGAETTAATDFVECTVARDYGLLDFAGISYFGCRFDVTAGT